MTVRSNIQQLLFLFLLIAVCSSCNKETTNTPETTTTVSKLSMLTANMWIYDSVYTNWGAANQAVSFARNGSSNTQDWSKERLKFYRDGTFDEILTTGVVRQGINTWTMNSDSTILNTTGGGYSNTVQVLTLTSAKLVWLDNANKTRGVQVPKY